MSTQERSTRITVSFTDTMLSEPIICDVPCVENDRKFPYILRRTLHKLKRISPINQVINKVGDNEYQLTMRRRADTLSKLTIHGHAANEYDVYIDKDDTVIDLKFLLSPLIDAKPEYIQLNYNTERRLQDNENVIKSNLLSSEIIIMFWLELDNPNAAKGESPIYRSVSHLLGFNPRYPNMGAVLRKYLKQNADQGVETWGIRKYLDKNNLSKRGEYEWTNYKTMNQRVTDLASGFRCLGLMPGKSKIGICSKNRREWLLSDYAGAVQSLITVPLYSTLDKNAIEYIINHAEIELVTCSAAVLPEVNRARSKCPLLKYIILMDEELPDQIYATEKDPQRQTYTHLFSEIEKLGKQKPFEDCLPDTESISTIMYTSGTTGNPKGVMITHRNLACLINSMMQLDLTEEFKIEDEHHLSYLPLAHVYERVVNLGALIRAIPVGFSSGVENIMEDMKILKPVVFYGVPRVFQRIQDGIMAKINSSNFIMKTLFNYAYNKKLYAIQHRLEPSAFWDTILWQKFRQPFGGKIRFAGSGSAPLSKESQTFLKVCLFELVGEGYGLTETTAAGTGSNRYDVKVGHVGMPRMNTEIKLVDVPDMGYLTTDKPLKRGEIFIRGPTVFKGYYKEPEKTRGVLGEDGWFATGDIGIWRDEGRLEIVDRKKNIFKLAQGEYIRPEYIQNVYKLGRFIGNCFIDGWFATGDIGIWRDEGRLEIVDRKKNIFKLAQGEYIRPEYIQNVYKLGRFIGNCFIDGNSLETYLVGIIVPDWLALIGFINNSQNGLSDLKGKSRQVIISDERVINLIRQDMKIQEEKAELNGFEKIKNFELKTEEFSQDNGLLTNSMKLKRNIARQRFATDIKRLYAKKSKL